MLRPSNSTSAYESFPADEFDAWVDHIRDTIIHGLEEPELEYPTLSNGALEAVKQAEREAAEAEARAQEEARVREEEARQAAQQRLEEQRQMLAQLQQKKQQLEEQRQLLAREQERQEQQRQEEERQRQEEEQQLYEEQRRVEQQRVEQQQREDVLRQRLQDARDRARQTQSQQGLMAQGEEPEEDAEYEQDSGEAADADQPEDDIFDDQASQDDQGRPYGYGEPTEDRENEPIDDREGDLFEDEQDPFEDEPPQFPTSPRSQAIYAEQQEVSDQGDAEELFDDEDQQQQTMEVDEPSRYASQSGEDGSVEQSDDEAQDRSSEQSEDQDARSASDEDVRSVSEEDVRSASEEDAESVSGQETASPQGFRRIYLPTHAEERDASASQEGNYEQGEESDDDRQDQVNSGSDTREVEYDGSEREDEAWQQDEQSRPRQLAQPASYPLPPNEFYGEDQNQVDSESDARQDESDESDEEEAGSEQDDEPQSRQLAEPASHPSPPIMSRGDASDAIEVIDSSDEENQSAPPRRKDASSAESEDEEEEAGSEPQGQASDEDVGSDAGSTQEREAYAQGEQYPEGDHDDQVVSPIRYAVTGTQRPSDYDMDDDESERGYESDEEGADEESAMQDPADQREFEFAGRQSSEDELAEDDEDQRSDTEMVYAAYTDVGRPRAISQRQSQSPIALDIDPSLQSEHNEVEGPVQMVQVSSQSIVARGLLQMAHGTGSLASTILDDTTNDTATDRAAIGDAHVPSDALEADLPEGDDLRIQEPQSEMIDAQVHMVDVVAEAVELEPSASRGAVGMEDAIPESTSAPELPRSVILSDLPAALPTSTSTEYEADNELLPEEAVSAAPSISTFSAIFANTPPHLSPTRERHAEFSVVEDVEAGVEFPTGEHFAPTSQHEEELRTQETFDIDVDAQAEDASVGSIESDAEGDSPTASTEDGDGSAPSEASFERVSSQHSAMDDITSPAMLETQETQEEIVSDDGQMIFEEQALNRAESDEQNEVDGHKMRNVGPSRKQESRSTEPALVDRSQSTSPASASDQEGMETDLPQPEEIPSQHETQEGRSKGNDTSDFDFHANVVRIQTPPDDQDELEDGEIRDSEDPVFPPVEASPAGEREEAIGPAIENSGVEAEDAARVAVPAQLEVAVEVDIDIEIGTDDAQNDEGADEQDSVTVSDDNEDDSGSLSETGNEDGISRGSADVMGSRLEDVRADEMEALEEDDEDSQINPEYDADETPSAEDIHYDPEDALPHSMTPEPEITEADPDDPSALPREIRKHNRRDIPHKDEHLVEEDEEFNNDSPEHHIDGTPAGYESYPVEDETNSEEFKIFEMAERDPGGIEGDRTTEQVMIEEMELRQQPGDPTRARQELPLAESSTRENGRDDEVVPAQQSSIEFFQDATPVSDSLPDAAKDAAVPSNNVTSSISESVSQAQADSHVKTSESAKSSQDLTKPPEIQTAPFDDAETPAKEEDAEDEDIFHVQPSLQEESGTENAAPASIVELLQSAELPQAPLHDRSPSPLAPEQELHHDIALAMEPAPLLHRHDHHHNVVVEESHKIHEEKRESFTSAIAAVHEAPSSSVEQFSDTQRESKGSSGEVDDTHVTTDGQAAPQGDMVVDDTDNLPTPPPAEAEPVKQNTQDAQLDDDDDPLRLSGPFNEQDSEPSPRISGTEVYVEIPILDRSHSWHSEPSGVRIEVEQHSTRPTTPVHPTPLSALSVDPTRHHHGPIHSASFSSIRSADLEISGSPAAHTRSQCHYHKIRFGRGVFSHVLLIPHCSIGTEEKRQQIGATDLGRVTKEEMLNKRDLDLGETFTSKMTSDVETLPDNLEHQVKQLAGAELLREGHIWLLRLADVAPQSVVDRTLQNAEVAQEDDVFHVRSSPRVSSSPRISNRVPSQTPDRKRKRASSRGRSTSATRSEGRSEGGSPESASLATRSRSRAAIVRKVSQIDEKDEDAQESKEEGQAEGVDETMGDDPVGVPPKPEEDNAVEEGEPPIDTADKEDRSLVASPEAASDPARSEKRASDDMEVDEEEVGDDRASKKRIIEGEDGEGPEAVDVRPVEKTGWLSWIFGKK